MLSGIALNKAYAPNFTCNRQYLGLLQHWHVVGAVTDSQGHGHGLHPFADHLDQIGLRVMAVRFSDGEFMQPAVLSATIDSIEVSKIGA